MPEKSEGAKEDAGSRDEQARRGRGPRLAFWLGGGATLLVVAYIEAGRLLETAVPIPFLLLFAVMVLAASLGGTRGGMASAGVVAAYIIYAAATAFGPPTLTGGPVQVALGIVLIGATALVLGRIRDQNTRLLQAELQGRSRLEQEVAERKQAEAALRKAHDELEERVAERTAELREANAALRESEARWRLLIEHHPETLQVSVDGILVYINRAGVDLFGAASAKEMIGRSLFDFAAPDVHDALHARRAVLAQGQATDPLEHEILRLGGEVRIVESFSIPILYQGKPAAQTVLRDVTARRRAEEMLRASERVLWSTLDGLAASIVLLDDQGHVLLVNKPWRTFAQDNGADPDAVSVGVNYLEVCDAATGEDAEDARRFAEGIRAVLAGERPAFAMEYACHSPDRQRWMIGRVTPYADDDPRRAVVAHENITTRKQAEAALRESEERYRALFEEASAARKRLEHLSRRLVEVQERERRQIALELHDEIGQLLTALNLMLETISLSEPQTIAGRLGQAQAVLDELMTKVRDLSLDLRPAMLDDFGLLPTLQWYTTRYTAQTQIRVHLQHEGLAEQRFSAEVETTAYRIIQEALTNVARYAEVAEAAVRVWTADDQLHVQIEDNGAGFDVAHVLKGAATGGLSGLHERAALLNGTVTISSRPGQGTRIDVILPG